MRLDTIDVICEKEKLLDSRLKKHMKNDRLSNSFYFVIKIIIKITQR